jgi:hypothetical protein
MDQQISIREISEQYASETIKALSIAQKMGAVSTEEDLRNLIAAGIETALEEFISKLEKVGQAN